MSSASQLPTVQDGPVVRDLYARAARGLFPNFTCNNDFELAMLGGIHASMLGAHSSESNIRKWLEERWFVHEQLSPGRSRQEIMNLLQPILDTPFATDDIVTGVRHRGCHH